MLESILAGVISVFLGFLAAAYPKLKTLAKKGIAQHQSARVAGGDIITASGGVTIEKGVKGSK